MTMWRREDIIWASGLIEGEGCITTFTTTAKAKKYCYWMLKVTSTDFDVLERVQSSFGVGRIYEVKNRPPRKQAYQYMLYRQPELYAVLVAIWPFMCSRRQARITEAILEMGSRSGWRANRRLVPAQVVAPQASCFN